MASNPIDCIKLHAKHLSTDVNISREAATDLALKEYEKLHGELENFKKSLDKKYTVKPFVSPDKSEAIKKINDEYSEKIKQETERANQQSELEAEKKSEPVIEPEKDSGGTGTGEPPPIKVVETNLDADGNPLSGIKKALVSESVVKGVDFEKVGDKDMMAMGRKILDSGEVNPDALVTKIITEGKGVLAPHEVVGLITYKRDIDTQVSDKTAEFNKKRAAGEDTGTLGVEIAKLEKQIEDYNVMSLVTAQQQSLAFRLRQYLLDKNYNAVRQIEKFKKVNNGTIPPEVESRLREMEKLLKEKSEEIKKLSEQKKDEEGQEAVDNIKESIDREKKYTDEELEKKVNEGVESEITKLYEELPAEKKSAADKAIKALEKFRAKIKSRTYESTLGIPAAIADLGAATAIRAIKIGKTIAVAVEMGINRIKKALKEKGIDKWDKEADYRKDLVETLEGEGVSLKQGKDKPVINEDGTVSIPNKMLRDLVERGVTDINDLTDAVHKEVVKDLPDITKRQVRDYITDYGKKVNPTADEVQTQINTAKRVGRLMSELEDLRKLNKIQFALKYKRPKPDANKITDIERDLKTKIKTSEKSLDISETAEEKNIKRLEKKLNTLLSGEVENTKEKRELSERENELNDQIAEAKKNLGLIRSKGTKTDNTYGLKDLEAKEQNKIKALEKQLSDLRQGIVKEKSEKTEDSDEVRELKEQIFEAKKNLGLIGSKNTPSTPNQLKITETEKKIERLEKEKNDLERGVVKQRGVSEKPSPAQQEKIDTLKDEIFELKKNLGIIKSKEIKEPLTEEDKLQIEKNRVKGRIAELERQKRTGNFSKKKKNKIKPTDEELEGLKIQEQNLIAEVEEIQYKNELKNRSLAQKIEDHAYEWSLGLTRGLTLGVDLSAPGIQGMRHLFISPIKSAQAFWESLKFLASEKYGDRFLARLKVSPYYPQIAQTGLIIDNKVNKVNVREAIGISNKVNYLWNKLVAPVLGIGTKRGTEIARKLNPYAAGQRAFDGFVNVLRTKIYIEQAKELERSGYTFETDPEVFKKSAGLANTETASAHLGKADLNSRWLNLVFTAPRKFVSEFKLYTPYALVYYARLPKAVRKRALLNAAKFTVSFVTVNAAIWALRKDWDDDEDDHFWDITSSDFMTHKIGNKRIGIGGGAKTMLNFIGRFWKGEYTDQYGTTTKLGERYGREINSRADLTVSLTTGKFTPLLGALYKKLDESKGREIDNEELLRNLAIPMWMQDLKDVYKDDPATVGAFINIMSILGAQTRVIDPKKQSQGNTIKPKIPKIAMPKEVKYK